MRLCNRYVAESLEPRFLLSMDPQLTPSAFAGMPAVFVPNQGQWDQAIRYAAHGAGADILFTDTGPTFRIVNRPDAPRNPFARGGGHDEILTVTRPVTVNEWSLNFVDAARVAPIGLDPQQTVFNYYLGDPSTWRAGVGSFGGVVYRDLWSGIDAYVIARDGGMKYEFHVDPGADPQDIALRYGGIEGLSLSKSGGLSIRTSGGTITDDAPIAWQERRDGRRAEVKAKFVLRDQFTYTIAPIGVYDPTLPLVLDPQLVFGSYLGGSGYDAGAAIAPDGAGGVWVTGATISADFPTPGGFDTTLDGEVRDAFVARVTAAGTLAFATYLGGGSFDAGHGITADGAGGAWVTGDTSSINFPAPGGFDTTINSGGDAFLAHMTAEGTLAFASYLGGSGTGEEYGDAITADGAGGAWVTGTTGSADFPTPGGFDTSRDGAGDAFVAHVTAEGTLGFASYLGGTGGDFGQGIAPDGAGGAWVTGYTTFENFPTPGGFDTTYNGSDDAFVARITAGGALAFASYLGGASNDIARGIATDGAGGVWVTGETRSNNFPTPAGFDTTLNGNFDAFVAHVTANGALTFASFLGGAANDPGFGIASDGASGAWVTGWTQSANFPTPNGFDTTYNGGPCDAFVARVTAGGTLAFASYLGGSGGDYGNAIASDGGVGAWMTGTTWSTNFPTPGGFDTTFNSSGSNDAFIVRISEDTTAPTVTTSEFAFDLAPQSIRITFSENVSASLSLEDLTLENLTTGQTIPAGDMELLYDSTLNIATITFPDYLYGALPNGNYRATLLAAGVRDAAGNPLLANHVLHFLFKLGDADNNGVIDFDDYSRIDNGFNNNRIGFTNGDFNYDGVIDFDDYSIIDFAFNTQ